MPIKLIIIVVIIACIIALIILFHTKKDDNNKYTKWESEKDAHELAVKARSGHGKISVLKAKPSSSEKTTKKKSEKNSIAHKTKNRSADEETVKKIDGNKESWQPYINMLQTRYPNMNQYLVLRSWGHPTFPGEYDGGLAFMRLKDIWYFCDDGFFYCGGEDKDMCTHNCYRLPDDFFDNTTWDNLEDKLRAVNWKAGSAVRSLFNCEAEDKAEIEKLFTRSPYRTMFKTKKETHYVQPGQGPYSSVLETKEAALSIHIETGELKEKTRCIVYERYPSELKSELVYPYEVTRSERAVSYDELDSLIEASEDKAAEQYKGMTADNWRVYF